MILSVCIATIAQFWKKSTFWSHDFETFHPKIGQCDAICTTALHCAVNSRYILTPSALSLITYILCKLWQKRNKKPAFISSIKKPFKCQITKLESLCLIEKVCLNHYRSMSRVTFFIPPQLFSLFLLGLEKKGRVDNFDADLSG